MPNADGVRGSQSYHAHLLRNHVAASSNCQSNAGFNLAVSTFGASMSFKSKAGKAHAASTASTTKAVNTSSALLDFNPRLLSQLCFVAWMQVSPPPSFLSTTKAHHSFSPETIFPVWARFTLLVPTSCLLPPLPRKCTALLTSFRVVMNLDASLLSEAFRSVCCPQHVSFLSR